MELPPWTISGVGLDLPSASVSPITPGELAISIFPDGTYVGHLPRARFDADGVHLVDDGDPYPGKATPDVKAAVDIAKVLPLLVSRNVLATRIAELVSKTKISVRLVARLHDDDDWVYGTLRPVIGPAADGTPITISNTTTVQDLAKQLDESHADRVKLVRQ